MHFFWLTQTSPQKPHNPISNLKWVFLSNLLILFQCQRIPRFCFWAGSPLTSLLICTDTCTGTEKQPSLLIYEDGTEKGYTEILKNEALGSIQWQDEHAQINTTSNDTLHSLNPDFSEHKHSQHPVLSVVRYIKISSTLRTLLVAHRLTFFLAASETKGNLYLMSRNVNTHRVHLQNPWQDPF